MLTTTQQLQCDTTLRTVLKPAQFIKTVNSLPELPVSYSYSNSAVTCSTTYTLLSNKNVCILWWKNDYNITEVLVLQNFRRQNIFKKLQFFYILS